VVSRHYRAPHASLYVGQAGNHLKLIHFEHIRYIKPITHSLYMLYISSKMYKHIDYSKTLRLFYMSVKVDTWICWKNAIFCYLITRTNLYQNNSLEIVVPYLALFTTSNCQTPLHDTLLSLIRICLLCSVSVRCWQSQHIAVLLIWYVHVRSYQYVL
jgi:hypothetical protein